MPFATFNRFEIELPRDDAEAGYHTGRCDDDIESLRYAAHVRAQLDRLDPDALRAELKKTAHGTTTSCRTMTPT